MSLDLVEEHGGEVRDTSNGTPLSAECDRIIRCFLASGWKVGNVRWDRTEWDRRTLYRGLWEASRKTAFRGRLRVHAQEGLVLLVKEGR